MKQVVRFAMLSGFSALAVLSVASAAHADTASDYNLFVLHNVTASNSDVEGRIAAGGNVNLTNYSVGLNQPSGTAADSLVAGGSLTANNVHVWNGDALASSGTASGLTVTNNGSQTTNTITFGSAPVDFAAEATRLLALSSNLSTYAATGTTVDSYGSLTFTGTQSGLNVFTLSGADLAAANSFIINVPTGSTALFNIDGTSDVFQNMGMSLSGITDQNILFNFYQATSLTVQGIGVMGSILAPSAAVTFNNGAINGQVLADSYQGMGQINYAPYQGGLLTARTPASPVPEPATWAMMIGGFGLVGSAMRRRRMIPAVA